MRIEVQDGTSFVEHVRSNTGSLENPMSNADIDAKFISCVTPELTDADVDQLLRSLRDLPASDSLGSFTTAIAAADMDSGSQDL
jgi:hypothetical protein